MLSIYRSLCQEFSIATYLYKLHIPANRKAMTKLRLSSHQLMIERGRWLNILTKDRLCTICNKLEDEFYVICECPRYEACRKLYIKPYYVRKPRMDKLIQLFNTDNTIKMQKLAIFIKGVFIRMLYLTSLLYYGYSLLDSGIKVKIYPCAIHNWSDFNIFYVLIVLFYTFLFYHLLI